MALDKKAVGLRITEVRGQRTLEAFGKMLGLSGPTIYRYEAGQIPSAEILHIIAQIAERPVDWLLEGKEYKSIREKKIEYPPSFHVPSPNTQGVLMDTACFRFLQEALHKLNPTLHKKFIEEVMKIGAITDDGIYKVANKKY